MKHREGIKELQLYLFSIVLIYIPCENIMLDFFMVTTFSLHKVYSENNQDAIFKLILYFPVKKP